jgi:mevalonate kinase
MGLFDNRLGELLSLVEEAGTIGRVSGAGGGDSAWALSDDPERLARAIEAAEEAGFQHLPVDFPAEGLRNLSRQESLC